ncbi:MAG: hypothetical protein ACRDCN_14650 [Tannerellaceae bacterium]
MKLEQIKKLAKAVVDTKANFSMEDGTTLDQATMNEVLREELSALSATVYEYEKNKYDIFSIISEAIDARAPKDIARFFEGFIETRQYGMNDKPEFEIKRENKQLRARAFVTQVSSAGVYEVFKLAKGGKVQVNMMAVGGACQIAYEDFLNGRVSWSELVEVVSLGLSDRVYDEVLKTLNKLENSLPVANKASTATFDPAALEKLIGIAGHYGSPVIFCTETFARTITEGTDWASEAEKVARRNLGYMANYKGARIVILPQSYTDENHTQLQADDSKAYIMPAGRGPLFKLALQGPTHVREANNEDWSKELHTYKRFGLAAFVYHDLCTYTITSLAE